MNNDPWIAQNNLRTIYFPNKDEENMAVAKWTLNAAEIRSKNTLSTHTHKYTNHVR